MESYVVYENTVKLPKLDRQAHAIIKVEFPFNFEPYSAWDLASDYICLVLEAHLPAERRSGASYLSKPLDRITLPFAMSDLHVPTSMLNAIFHREKECEKCNHCLVARHYANVSSIDAAREACTRMLRLWCSFTDSLSQCLDSIGDPQKRSKLIEDTVNRRMEVVECLRSMA
ncbi:MAG: hypothetical protein QXT45_03540 [Candidatus Bilamarchaeaceae archaeon]